MKKICDLQYELNKAIDEAADATLGKEMTLRELLTYGWSGIRTADDHYLGFEEVDFSEYELDTIVTVLDEYFKDSDGYFYVKVVPTLDGQ